MLNSRRWRDIQKLAVYFRSVVTYSKCFDIAKADRDKHKIYQNNRYDEIVVVIVLGENQQCQGYDNMLHTVP